MEKKKLTPKAGRKIHIYMRRAIQLLFFLFFPSAFTAAFAGVKYLFTQMGLGNRVEWTSFTVLA